MAFYQLTGILSDTPWWTGRKWQTQPVANCSTQRNLGHDGLAAWKLFNRMPKGFVLLKFNGKRGITEWERT